MAEEFHVDAEKEEPHDHAYSLRKAASQPPGIVTLGRPGSGWAAVTDEAKTTDDSPCLMTVTNG
jgi:hypothetical protein